MNSIDFCYWLQGYFEISGDGAINSEKTKMVKDHLNLVFKHEIDPLRESQTDTPKKELDAAHNGGFDNDVKYRC